MIGLTVIRDIDTAEGNPLKGIPPDKIIHVASTITIGTLTSGMESGKTSVGLIIPLEDGTFVLAETSLVLMKAALRILNVIPE